MKNLLRSLLFALLSVVLVSEAAAQSPPAITFSVAGGFNLSRLSLPLAIDDELDEFGASLENGSRIGFVAGGLVDFGVASATSIVTGGLVSTRGGSFDVGVPQFGNVEADIRMIYVDVPAFVAVGVAGAAQNRFELIGGAMLGLTVQGRQTASGFGVSVDEDFTDELPGVDVGLSIGGRYSRGHLFGAAYYTWGLTDLTEGDSPEPIRHRYLTVTRRLEILDAGPGRGRCYRGERSTLAGSAPTRPSPPHRRPARCGR